MSRLQYTGTFAPVVDDFQNFDKVLIDTLSTIAKNVGDLNANWNDEKSNKYLTSFNNFLTDAKSQLDDSHTKIAQYFSDIQEVLKGQPVEFPALGKFDLSSVNASSTNGSILFDEEKVISTLSNMKTQADSIKTAFDGFKPTASPLEGSSDDIIESVQGNLNAARNSYSGVDTSINEMARLIQEVLDEYTGITSAISGSGSTGGTGYGANTNMAK